ncbi:methenyltetrahydromethanopterin cyclohydrolase [Candidatus Bathyarchaeota archaeon]|nr:methenyltetrahydromethanopterin cyclohydrolase [Candidatus Bathyarchaeota archaeon]
MPKGKSVNAEAARIIKSAIEDHEFYHFAVDSSRKVTIVDAGVNTIGSALAGVLVTDICLGGLGKTHLTFKKYGSDHLPSVFVEIWSPAVATLGSQYAGWEIKTEDYFAMGSGPARALALKPRNLYEKIGYRDQADEAVLVLESEKLPTQTAIEYLVDECDVSPEDLYLVVTPTSSLAGSVQIAGRVVETGVHKLVELGMDPKSIVFGSGFAPLPPVHPNPARAMGRTNDAILYGGVTHYTVNMDDDETLMRLVSAAPSSTSRHYGKPFYEILKDAKYDFYKIDPDLFAPSVVSVSNMKTGFTYTAGQVNEDILREVLGQRRLPKVDHQT